MRGAINGAGTVPFKSNSVQPFISGIRAAQYLILCVVFCWPLFVISSIFLVAIVLSVLH
jgi:hypothetical protein